EILLFHFPSGGSALGNRLCPDRLLSRAFPSLDLSRLRRRGPRGRPAPSSVPSHSGRNLPNDGTNLGSVPPLSSAFSFLVPFAGCHPSIGGICLFGDTPLFNGTG